MHVFCPDCNAEFKVSERSSLTKTIKFVCIECGSSWIDKFEKLEKTKKLVTDTDKPTTDDLIDNVDTELEKMELNSIALEEVENSFGNYKNRIETKNNNTEDKHLFKFETNDVSKEIGEEGPSKTFPKIRSNKQSTTNEQVEERDAKEIEIEKRLKESSELLKKAQQPHIENKDNTQVENNPKSQKFLVTFSVLLVFSFFAYSLTVLFLEDILREVPFAPEVLSEINRYMAIFENILQTIFERITSIIPNLA